jgi:hypothetical protein
MSNDMSSGAVEGEELEDSSVSKERTKFKKHGYSRSLSGIHGIASDHPQKPAVLMTAPTTSDIRKARQLAARSRALVACIPCKTARWRILP